MTLSAPRLLSAGLYLPGWSYSEAFRQTCRCICLGRKQGETTGGGNEEKEMVYRLDGGPGGELASSSVYTESAMTSDPPERLSLPHLAALALPLNQHLFVVNTAECGCSRQPRTSAYLKTKSSGMEDEQEGDRRKPDGLSDPPTDGRGSGTSTKPQLFCQKHRQILSCDGISCL